MVGVPACLGLSWLGVSWSEVLGAISRFHTRWRGSLPHLSPYLSLAWPPWLVAPRGGCGQVFGVVS